MQDCRQEKLWHWKLNSPQTSSTVEVSVLIFQTVSCPYWDTPAGWSPHSFEQSCQKYKSLGRIRWGMSSGFESCFFINSQRYDFVFACACYCLRPRSQMLRVAWACKHPRLEAVYLQSFQSDVYCCRLPPAPQKRKVLWPFVWPSFSKSKVNYPGRLY